MRICDALSQRLPDSPTEQLDVSWLLAHAMKVSVTHLRTWPEQMLTQLEIDTFQALRARRLMGEPIAYLLKKQGFWNLVLEVSPSTLIPRPDTETLIECVLTLDLPKQAQVVDLGTGTGAIALALARERPHWQILGIDLIPEAIDLARRNQIKCGLNQVVFQRGDWCAHLGQFDLMVSNPPYIAEQDPHLQVGDLRFEPHTALVSGADGLDDIRILLTQAPQHLKPHGWLVLEHGYNQSEAVKVLFQQQGFANIAIYPDTMGHPRVTSGQWLNGSMA